MPSPPQQPRLHGILFLDLTVPLKEKMPNTGWGGGGTGAAAVNFNTLKRSMAGPHLHENVSAPWENMGIQVGVVSMEPVPRSCIPESVSPSSDGQECSLSPAAH